MIKGEYIIKLSEAPENCFECLFIREEIDKCIFTRDWVDDNGVIPESCPIIKEVIEE